MLLKQKRTRCYVILGGYGKKKPTLTGNMLGWTTSATREHAHTPTLPHSRTPTIPYSHNPSLPHSYTPILIPTFTLTHWYRSNPE